MQTKFCLIAVASLAMGYEALAAEEAAQPQEPIAAALKLHEADFVYRTSRNYLSCDELQNGVAVILRALGARDDVDVRVSNCSYAQIPDATISNDGGVWNNQTFDRSTRQQSPMERMRGETNNQSTALHIRAMLPVPANKKVLKEMEQDKARRELISRVTGNPAAALNDPILFAATRQQVTLSHDTIKLQPEHCELLDQMTSSVLRRFDMRVVNKTTCDPHQRSNFPPKATIEALLPVGYVLPGSDKKQKKEKEEKEQEAQEEQQQQEQAQPQEQAPPQEQTPSQ